MPANSPGFVVHGLSCHSSHSGNDIYIASLPLAWTSRSPVSLSEFGGVKNEPGKQDEADPPDSVDDGESAGRHDFVFDRMGEYCIDRVNQNDQYAESEREKKKLHDEGGSDIDELREQRDKKHDRFWIGQGQD
jgi:hypothetical protein